MIAKKDLVDLQLHELNYICQLKLITKQDEPCTIAFADIMNYLQA